MISFCNRKGVPERPSRQKYLLPVMFALLVYAISLRHTHTTRQFVIQPYYELDSYAGYGQNILAGYGYGDCYVDKKLRCTALGVEHMWNRAYRLPGYPLFLTGGMILFGTDNFIPPILMLQSGLAAMIVLLTVALAQRWGPVAGLSAGIFLLISAALYYLASLLMTEIFFTFLLMIFIWMFLHARRTMPLLLTGMLLGALLETRGTLLFVIPLLFFVVRRKRDFAWLLAGMLFPIGLWTYRNYTVFQAFVPFSTGSGQVLYGANNAIAFRYAPGAWWMFTDLPGKERFVNLPELEQDRALHQAVLDYLRHEDFREVIAALFFKVLAFCGLYYEWYWAANLGTGGIAWLMLTGCLVRSRRRRSRFWAIVHQAPVKLFIMLLTANTLNTLVFWANYRMRFPMEPVMAILTGIAVMLLFTGQAPAAGRMSQSGDV